MPLEHDEIGHAVLRDLAELPLQPRHLCGFCRHRFQQPLVQLRGREIDLLPLELSAGHGELGEQARASARQPVGPEPDGNAHFEGASR
jgi:hypothetical protein